MTTAVIAIDGPSGSGKSTVARLVADRLGYLYLNTGAMYRAVALYLKVQGVDCRDESVLNSDLENVRVDFDLEGRICLNGADMSDQVLTHEASRLASDYSRLPSVRERLTQLQRAIGCSRPSVLEGRDIGTVVFPDAAHKFFLDATQAERARRRLKQLQEQDPEGSFSLEEILNSQIERDRQDSGRALAPLRQAEDAVYIDTTGKSIEDVVQEILDNL